MYYVDTHRDTLLERLRATGLSRGMSLNMYYYMRRIEVNSGIGELVRLFKFHYITLLNAELENLRIVNKGPLKAVYRAFKFGSDRTKGRMLSIFKLIGLFKAPTPTKEDYNKKISSLKKLKDKFHTSCWSDYKDSDVDLFNSLTVAPFSLAKVEYEARLSLPLSTATIPIVDPKRMAKTGLRFSSVPGYYSMPVEAFSTMVLTPRLILNNYEYCKDVIGDILPTRSECTELIRNSKHDWVGRAVMLNKDRGLKLRLIASVSYHVQLLVNPIHSLLKNFLKSFPSCYCFDQDGGVEQVRLWLEQGEKLSSLDLLDATDGMPLSLQVEVIRKSLSGHPDEVMLQKALKVFYEASQLRFETPFGTYVKWYRGGPMGMRGGYYSFCYFLISIFEAFHIPRDAYVLVGDDLVSKAKYTKLINWIVTTVTSAIQTSKSIYNSGTFAEFCGRVIMSSGPLQVYKANVVDMDKDPTGLLRQYGINKAMYFKDLAGIDKTTMMQYKAKVWLDVNNLHPTVQSLLDDNKVLEPPTSGGLTPYQYFRMGYYDDYVLYILTYLQYCSLTKQDPPNDKVHDYAIILESFLFENIESYDPDDPMQEFAYGFDAENDPYPAMVDSFIYYINAQYEHDIHERFLPNSTFVPKLEFEEYYSINSISWGRVDDFFEPFESLPPLIREGLEEQAYKAADYSLTEVSNAPGAPYFEGLTDKVEVKFDFIIPPTTNTKSSGRAETTKKEPKPEISNHRWNDWMGNNDWVIGSPAHDVLFLATVFLPMLPIILLTESLYEDKRECPLVPRLRALFNFITYPIFGNVMEEDGVRELSRKKKS